MSVLVRDIAGTSSDDHASNAPAEFFLLRQMSSRSRSSFCESEDEELEEATEGSRDFVPGPLISLKDQLDKDKEDESLRRWKEQLLGNIQIDSITEPAVELLNLTILSPGRRDMLITFPRTMSNSKEHLFTLKEGSSYNLKLTFTVSHNIVSGLIFLQTVWKNGFKVDHTKVMMGTFSPQIEPYIHVMEEDTTPSGILARGNYSAKAKFIDDDGRCHMELEYTFDIRKEW